MTWNKRIKYDEWNKIIRNEINVLQKEKQLCELKHKPVPKMVSIHLAYNSIMLTQLENGVRISEAVETILKYVVDNKREQKVKARKRKKKVKVKDNDGKETGEFKIVGSDVLVLIIIPSFIKKHYLDGINKKTPKQIKNGVCLYAINHYKINTHSLRYSWIAKMGEKKVPSHLISKAIRHTNIQTIDEYTDENQADDIKRSFVK